MSVLWTYMNIYVQEGTDIKNKEMIVNKTEGVEENFMVAQNYVDVMSSNMLELLKSQLNIVGLHENTSHGSQQCCDEDWIDIANEGNPTSIRWFSLERMSICKVNKMQTCKLFYSTMAEIINKGGS